VNPSQMLFPGGVGCNGRIMIIPHQSRVTINPPMCATSPYIPSPFARMGRIRSPRPC
jgi:hypothetical protein